MFKPKNIGYELRCVDPIPFDMEYARDLGHCAAEFILKGGNAAMISIVNGCSTPIPFVNIIDQATGRARVRHVAVDSESYRIARQYMIRLSREDFEQEDRLAKIAAVAGIAPEAFRKQFLYTIEDDPMNSGP